MVIDFHPCFTIYSLSSLRPDSQFRGFRLLFYWHVETVVSAIDFIMLNTKQFEGLTFDKMPQAIEYLVGTVNQLQNLLLQHLDKEKLQRLEDRWLNTADLIEYHPDHPARSTIYAWVAANIIPYHKTGKKLQSLQSEIDEWIKSTRNKTDEEIQDNAINYVNQRRIAK